MSRGTASAPGCVLEALVRILVAADRKVNSAAVSRRPVLRLVTLVHKAEVQSRRAS